MHGWILLLLLSSHALALNVELGPNQTIGSGQLAYYGEGFPGGGDLKATLFTILSSRHTSRPGRPDQIGHCASGTCYEHNPVGYGPARNIMFGELFNERDGRGQYVVEVYCEKEVRFRQLSDISGMNNVVNIEHTWPQSRFSERHGKEIQKSDLHHLFPSDSRANSIRGNFEFGEEGGQDLDGCPGSQIADTPRGRVFTPPTHHRGNVARALFYFSVRYQTPISREEEATLRRWHRQDPVDGAEEERNDLIAMKQGNRNPFIDYPALVDQIRDF